MKLVSVITNMPTVSAWQRVIRGTVIIPELRLDAGPGYIDKTGNYNYYGGPHYDKHHI